jgi:hypothetical protein
MSAGLGCEKRRINTVAAKTKKSLNTSFAFGANAPAPKSKKAKGGAKPRKHPQRTWKGITFGGS